MHHREPSHAAETILAFLAGVVVTVVAGGYYLFGPRGRMHRARTQVWIDEASEEIRDRALALKDVTKAQFDTIVDEVVEGYRRTGGVAVEEASRAAVRLKAQWHRLRQASRESADEARRELEDEE